MAKKMRTLYFRGFPIDAKQNILQWMKQYDISGSEEIYTLGNLADTAVVIFKDENSLWTFLRQCPNNKWHTYGSSQIYVGLDNQIRGQRPEENKAIRKLYRACIQILSAKHPNEDISQTHVYRNYSRGIVKIHNGSDWEEVAHWDANINKLIFSSDLLLGLIFARYFDVSSNANHRVSTCLGITTCSRRVLTLDGGEQ